MAARPRALLVLVSLMAALAGTSLMLVSGSGSVLPAPRQAVAAATRDVSVFKGEVLV